MEIEPFPVLSTNPAKSTVCHVITFDEGGYTQKLVEHPLPPAAPGCLPELKSITLAEVGFGFARDAVCKDARLYQTADGLLSTEEASSQLVGTALANAAEGEMTTFRRVSVDQGN